MDSTSYMSCELKVDTKSPGWQKTLTKMLEGIKEVSYTIDAQAGIAYVSGRIKPNTLLLLFEKAGKHAELLRVDSGYPHYETRRSLLHENGCGYYPRYEPITRPPLHYSHNEPITTQPMPPSYHPYYEPGFDVHQPSPMDDAHFDSDSQCSIM